MKHTYKILLITLVASFINGCNLDVNTDPNRVTETTVTGALIFPAAAHETGQRVASGNFTFLEDWLGYFAASGTFAIDATETTYNITPAFGDALWQNNYNVLFDLEQARSKALASGDNLTAAASMILAARLWQDLVDIYGNIPYSQAFQYAKYPLPAYDKGQDIYNDLQVKLDQAITYMSSPGLSSFSTIDIVNGGNQTKWIKFANSLKLRLLIRQSEISGFSATAEATKIMNNGGVLQAGETVFVNPGYTNATNKQSPFYANYGQTVNAAEAAPAVRANNYFKNLMQANSDPRLNRYFIPISGNVVGCTYGLAAGNPLVSSGVGAGLANNSAQNQWIFTSVESLFLEVEAIERGWITNDGSAAAKYSQAIAESFTFLGVANASSTAAAYVTAFPYLGGSTANLKKMLLQKYISMCGIAPLEAWSDLRRIGFDILPATAGGVSYYSVNPGVVGGGAIPVRLLYAQSEYTTNADNVNAQGTINQFTSKIFWDVN